MLILLAMAAAWMTGRWASRIRDPWRRGSIIGVAVLLLMGWSLLIRHPAVAVEVIPLSALSRLEGVGAAPLFIFVMGVGWGLSTFRRQRAVLIIGTGVGIGYFLQGGLWMMQPTPTHAFSNNNLDYCVYQTQDYSCVPAASATAVRLLGIVANEEEMAQLTETRAGTGATLLRALNGLDHKLKRSDIKPRLLEVDFNKLQNIEPPMLTPLRYDAGALHMVCIVEARPHLVVIVDPQVGLEFLSRYEFESRFRGHVIAFEGKAKRATTIDVLREFPYAQDPDRTALR